MGTWNGSAPATGPRWPQLAGAAMLLAVGCGGDGSSSAVNNGSAGAGANGSTATGTSSTGAPGSASSGSGGTILVGNLNDDFAGDGPLIDYTTNNANALPDVARVGGRYRANLVDNTNDMTLHYNDAQGRLDAKLVTFPFEIIVRNIGIGTQANPQMAPPGTSEMYIFAGVQVHVMDLNARHSSHVVVGHRGNTHFTVEGKNTVAGDSAVNDVGAGAVPAGRADIRVVGNADHTLTISWQTPNSAPGKQADAWTLYNDDGRLPGPAPAYDDTVYVGLITYAFGNSGVPFVGTADAIEGGSVTAGP